MEKNDGRSAKNSAEENKYKMISFWAHFFLSKIDDKLNHYQDVESRADFRNQTTDN